MKIYAGLTDTSGTHISSKSKRGVQVPLVDFAKEEKIKEVLSLGQDGAPVLLPASDILASNLPSVTRILQGSKSPLQMEILDRWKQKMIREMGLKGFTDYQERGDAKNSIHSINKYILNNFNKQIVNYKFIIKTL